MVFDSIEKLKQDYTDKYVLVDSSRPELRRFGGMTGVIKTVNMNGRALVQFDGNQNVGWYDIDLEFLKVVDKPLEKPVADKAKPAKAEKAEKPTDAKPAAAAKPAAKAAPGAKPGLSMADILAAARGGAAPAPAAAKPAEKAAPKAAEKPAAAPAAGAGKAMSIQDILAAARGGKPAPAPAAAVAPAAEAVAAPAEPEATPKPAPAPAKKTAAPAGSLPKDVAGIVAFCRDRDSK